jgi:nitrite reductase (NADH) small subunit
MPNWIPIANVDDCPPGEAIETVAGDRVVALFNVDGNFFALDGVCPHQGGPLGKGCLAGNIVTCPWHGWQYDVTTGKHQLSSITQPTLPTKVEDGQVLVGIA